MPIFHGHFRPVRVGYFLAWRQIVRSSRGTTALIVFIMTLTFLNLTVVNGILLGLIAGSSTAYRQHYSGDVLITALPNKAYIERTGDIVKQLRNRKDVEAVSPRFLVGGRAQANYRELSRPSDIPDTVGAEVLGINPVDESAVAHIDRHIVSGRPLSYDSVGEVLVGSGLLTEYTRGAVPGDALLSRVRVGSRIRVSVGGDWVEVTVRGVVKSKITQVNKRIFFLDRELRQLAGRADGNVGEIAVKLTPGGDPLAVQRDLLRAGNGAWSVVKTWEEAQGSFFKDLEITFRVLSDVIGSIALAVASLTVFIVVLINALTRKRFIGIMKGIGIDGAAISVSYVIQSLVYAAAGSAVGFLLLYGFIKPYFDANPIDFPFSDGILVADMNGVLGRFGVLLVMTLLAGYVPARLIVRRNTLDTILNR